MTKFHIISADSHVVEPPDLWLNYIEPRFKDRAPRLIHKDEGDVFEYEGQPFIAPMGMAAGAGKPSDQLRRHGRFDRDVPKGAWDPQARLGEIAVDGVDGEVLYPTVACFMFGLKDLEFQSACFQAYNNWLADFCAAHPDRLKGFGLMSLASVEHGVQDLHRIRRQGLVGGLIAIYPDEEQQYSEPRYDPLWAAAQDLDMPISLHVNTERNFKVKRTMADNATSDVHIRRSLTFMVTGGVFERFPRLKIISAENDVGWVPYFLERMDYLFDRTRNIYQWTVSRTMLPSEYIRRQVYFTFMRDSSWVPARHLIGLDRLMWASDYPHTDSTWPRSREVIARMLQDVPEEERRKITLTNAGELYHFF